MAVDLQTVMAQVVEGNKPASTTATTVEQTVATEQQSATTEESAQQAVAATDTQQQVVDPIQAMLEKYNLKSIEELEQKLSPKEEKTAEQIANEEKVLQANLDKYLQDKGIMGRDEIIKLEVLKGKANKDIAVENFISEFKEDNPDATEDEIEEAVELRYHFNSGNERLKKAGEKQLVKDAELIKAPLENKFNNAKSQFLTESERAAKIPAFVTTLKKSIVDTTLEPIEIYSKDGIVVNHEITKEEQAELSDNVLHTQEVFDAFLKYGANSQEFKDEVKAKSTAYLLLKNFKANNEKIADVVGKAMHKKGIEEGSVVGSLNPFGVHQATTGRSNAVSPQEAEAAMLNSLNYIKQN